MSFTIKVDANGYPVVDQFSEEGFIDFVFRIENLIERRDKYRFNMRASYDQQILGVDVSVVKPIGPGFDDNMKLIKDHVYPRGVVFTRSGPESDRLIQTIAVLYDSDCRPKQMIEHEAYTAIALHQGHKDMANEAMKIKLFGCDSEEYDENDYYESFFNLDLANGNVFWNEKDQAYREPLVRALGRTGQR